MRLPAGVLPAGWSFGMLLLRAALFALPVAALMMALPEVPHWASILLVTACALVWARQPDNLAGTVTLVLVMGWWAAHGVVDRRLLVVAFLLVLAHVLAIVLSHGPGTLRVDRDLALLWTRRGMVALLPLGVAYAAIRGLDADLAPPWLWTLAALVTIGLTVAAGRLTLVDAE